MAVSERSRRSWTRAWTRAAASALLVLSFAALSACEAMEDPPLEGDSAEETEAPAGRGDPGRGRPADPRSDAERREVAKEPAVRGAAEAPALPQVDRSLVHHGQMWIEVARPEDAIASFLKQVATIGGHLQQQYDRTVVVRVPTAKFDEVFTLLRSTGRVISEARQIDDATEELQELTIRIDTARKARDRLLEVLQKADKVEDLLKVEVELRRLNEEIELMEARKRLLTDRIAMATIEATFLQSAEAPTAGKTRKSNRFAWIDALGAERVMEDF